MPGAGELHSCRSGSALADAPVYAAEWIVENSHSQKLSPLQPHFPLLVLAAVGLLVAVGLQPHGTTLPLTSLQFTGSVFS